MAMIHGKSFMMSKEFVHGYRLGSCSATGNGVRRTRRPSKPAVEVDLQDPKIADMVRRFRGL